MKRSEQEAHVQQWKESGLTQKSYCEKLGVKRTTFANWASRNKEKPKTGFIAISPVVAADLNGIELIYPNGVHLKTSSATIELLSELIRCYPCSA